jgi:hypothetical protein
MLTKFTVSICLALGLAVSSALAQNELTTTIRLVCAWTNTIDTKTLENSKITGATLITVEPDGVLRREGLGAFFRARVTAEKIEAETEYQLGGPQVFTERIEINRYTGKIEKWFLIGNEGLIHYGTCKPVTRQLF